MGQWICTHITNESVSRILGFSNKEEREGRGHSRARMITVEVQNIMDTICTHPKLRYPL